MSSHLSRRDFITKTSAAIAVTALAVHGESPSHPKIIGFSKPFGKASPQETADIVAEIGWHGIECPVRAKGQVEPERVEEDLPKYVEALRKTDREITIVTTDVEDAVAPAGLKVLQTAAKLGIKRYRMKHFYYDLNKPIPGQLEEFGKKMKDLTQVNAQLGIQGGFQNHSGNRYVGAPLWDAWLLVKDLNPKHMGVCFDIGHATIEGGTSWPIQVKLLQSRFTAVFVKDFSWKKSDKGWNAEWCPLGDGMVNKNFFKERNESGIICQHHEYKLGEGKTMVAAMKKDFQVLKQWLAGA